MVFFLDLSFCNLIKGSLARTRIIEKSFVKFLTSMDFLLFNFLFLSPSIGCLWMLEETTVDHILEAVTRICQWLPTSKT